MRKFRRGWQKGIREAVERAAWESSASAAAVHKDLAARFPDLSDEDIPTERTLRDWLKDLRRDPTEPWTFAEEEDPEDVAFLLRIWATAIEYPTGLRPRLTLADARWLLRLRDACEGLADIYRYMLVRLLVNEAVSLETIQAFLAFRPWLGEEEAERYRDALERGSIPGPEENQYARWLLIFTRRKEANDAQD